MSNKGRHRRHNENICIGLSSLSYHLLTSIHRNPHVDDKIILSIRFQVFQVSKYVFYCKLLSN